MYRCTSNLLAEGLTLTSSPPPFKNKKESLKVATKMGVHFYTAYPAAVKNLNLKVPPVAFIGFVSNLSRTVNI